MSIFQAVDLFAGPGGWDVALRNIGQGRLVAGIENDDAACETRLANGLVTFTGNVRHENPLDRMWTTYTATEGLIASPPCQTFSTAGKGAGRDALDVVLLEGESLWRGAVDRISYEYFKDERTGLVLEPLRWAMERINAGSPFKWIALEQVPSVLPVWEMFARLLREAGYSVVTSVVSAEQYGVPQTRRRAVLLAHATRDVKLPTATHRKYKKGVPQDAGDQDLKPWVSMADALGWSGLVGFPRLDDGREAVEIDGTAYRARDLRPADLPAQAVTEKARSWQRRNSGPGAARAPRSTSEPSYTIRANGSGSHPSGTEWLDDAGCAVRVTAQEAAALQTFPADYNWQGSRTKQFQQIGNAIPPVLAEALLREVL